MHADVDSIHNGHDHAWSCTLHTYHFSLQHTHVGTSRERDDVILIVFILGNVHLNSLVDQEILIQSPIALLCQQIEFTNKPQLFSNSLLDLFNFTSREVGAPRPLFGTHSLLLFTMRIKDGLSEHSSDLLTYSKNRLGVQFWKETSGYSGCSMETTSSGLPTNLLTWWRCASSLNFWPYWKQYWNYSSVTLSLNICLLSLSRCPPAGCCQSSAIAS